MPSQFVFALKMRIKQGFSLLVHVRCFVPVVLCSVLLFLFVIFVLSRSHLHEESGFVAGRWRRRRSTGRGETVAGKEWADTGGVQSGGAWC